MRKAGSCKLRKTGAIPGQVFPQNLARGKVLAEYVLNECVNAQDYFLIIGFRNLLGRA